MGPLDEGLELLLLQPVSVTVAGFRKKTHVCSYSLVRRDPPRERGRWSARETTCRSLGTSTHTITHTWA